MDSMDTSNEPDTLAAEFYLRTLPTALAVATSIGRDPEAAWDDVQDSYIATLCCGLPLNDYERTNRLLNVTRRLAARRVNQKTAARKRMVPVDALDLTHSANQGPADIVAIIELIHAVEGILRNIPANDRELITFYFIKEWSQVEISNYLGINQSSVCRGIRKALKECRHVATALNLEEFLD